MLFDEIMDVIKKLACSQGSYGRLLEAINELDEDELDKLIVTWEDMEFKSPVDFILYIEG